MTRRTGNEGLHERIVGDKRDAATLREVAAEIREARQRPKAPREPVGTPPADGAETVAALLTPSEPRALSDDLGEALTQVVDHENQVRGDAAEIRKARQQTQPPRLIHGLYEPDTDVAELHDEVTRLRALLARAATALESVPDPSAYDLALIEEARRA